MSTPRSFLGIAALQEMQLKEVAFDLGVIPEKPEIPATFTVIGLKFGFRCVWSRSPNADGYEILIAAGNNMSSPIEKIEVSGRDTMSYEYFVGDQALARTFTIHSYKVYKGKERIYSNLFYPFRTATSKNAAGAADSTPITPPIVVPPPSGEDIPPPPGGIDSNPLV